MGDGWILEEETSSLTFPAFEGLFNHYQRRRGEPASGPDRFEMRAHEQFRFFDTDPRNGESLICLLPPGLCFHTEITFRPHSAGVVFNARGQEVILQLALSAGDLRALHSLLEMREAARSTQ
jgi:hypothetical protein